MKTFFFCILISPEFWGIFIPAFVAIGTFFWTEKNKLMWEQYKQKEKSYSKLLKSLRGFYENTQSQEAKQLFIDEVNQCWLYAPDDVINAAYHFLDTVHTGCNSSDEEKKESLGEFVVLIRTDLLRKRIVKKSNLNSRDFRHFRPN